MNNIIMFLKAIRHSTKRILCIAFNSTRNASSALIGRPPGIDNKFHQKYVRVSVLGANTPTGEPTAFLLKQNPLISQLYLHGTSHVLGIAADLKHVDTRCEVKAYSGRDGLPHVLRRADIVIILGLDKCLLNTTAEVSLQSEGERVVELAEACSRYAPKSIVLVCAHPIACTLPLVAAVFRRTHWYHPARIIGSTALAQVRTNSLAARYQDLDPVSVHVPLVGGPDTDCVVPLFSRATPINVPPADGKMLYQRLKDVDKLIPIETPTPCPVGFSSLSEAYGINQLVTTIGVGLCGDDTAVSTAFVRQAIIPTCRHLVTTVKFGPGGVVHNYGLPKLTKPELRNLEKATILLARREQLTQDFLSQIEKRHSRTQRTHIAEFSPHAHEATYGQ